VVTLDASLEQLLQTGVQHTQSGSFLAVEPALLDRLLRGIQASFETKARDGAAHVLLTGQSVRAPLRQLLARVLPRVVVLSHNELPPDIRVVARGEVRLADAHQTL
jgi:flagellar biosynthesis protein FlhA